MEEFSQQFINRIKSPIFGYFFVSFIALNWDPIFYLFFHSASVPLRINYFKEYVDVYSAFVYPFLISIVYSIAYPWINLCIGSATSKSIEISNNLTIDADHRTTIKKTDLEKVRLELSKVRENAVLDRAVLDQKINEIDDEKTREKLKVELNEIRNPDSDNSSNPNIFFPEFPIELQSVIAKTLIYMSDGDVMLTKNDLGSMLGFSNTKNDVIITELIIYKYIQSPLPFDKNELYSVTPKAKKILVDKNLVN